MENEKMIQTAFFIALGIALPYIFHFFALGPVFLPMHLPVFLCGALCGHRYGAVCGLILPYFSFLLNGMPPIYPVGISMSFELGAYGLLMGFLFAFFGLKHGLLFSATSALLITMLAGRLVAGIANLFLLGLTGEVYTLGIFLTSMFLKAVPGMILQIILIPCILKVIINRQKA